MARCFGAIELKLYASHRNKKLLELAEKLDNFKGVVDANSAGIIDEHLWHLKDDIVDTAELLDTLQCESANADQTLKKLKKLLDDDHWSLQNLPRDSQYGSGITRRTTRPQPAKDKLFGYGKEYAALLSSLVPPDDPEECQVQVGDARVVAIIGHAGTGKTELARWAFNNEDKVRANFDLRIWVCVHAKFTETDLLREICKSADAGCGADVAEMDVTGLQQKLGEIIVPEANKNRRYLLVLDDVCNDESAASELTRKKTWDVVLAPFMLHGGSGSRILMTTRAEICSTTLDAGARIVLNGISADALALLLMKTAFGDEHANLPMKLQEAIRNNIGRLHGSPLAAEEVGCILRGNKDTARWKSILDKDHQEGLFHAHLSSYLDLPPHLKRCFAFCSIFPMKWEFEPEKLVKMWVALGFVEAAAPPPGTDWMAREEDVAREYFDALLRRSFFRLQESSTLIGGGYVIHEHVHSMLRRVASHYCLNIDDGPLEAAKIARTVRHVCATPNYVRQLATYPPDWLKKLRTLLVYIKEDGGGGSSTAQASMMSVLDSSGILMKSSDMRVLDLSGTCIAQLPRSVRELRHLRYLGLPRTIKGLGAHVNKLMFLQTLAVKGGKIMKLPGDMSRLIRLRHLDVDMECIAQIGGIGSMQMLQGSVELDARNRKKGYGMRELERLNSLRRTLCIKGLETVGSKREAESAHLEKKNDLEVLKLEWGHRSEQQAKTSAGSGSDSIVLAGLRPHPNLQELHITRYQGTTWPGWLADAGALQNLRSLHLRNCRKLVALPPVGELPRLEVLVLKELCSVERIDGMLFCGSGAFRSLEKMVVNDMPALLAWDAPAEATTGGLFPQLRKLEIVDCPKLSSLSGLLCCRASLSVLCVKRCPAVKATFSRSSFPSLVKPDLQGCPGLQFQFQG